jgi:hypothetical protein
MSKPNDPSSPHKGTLSSSVREKLRLQLPIPTDQPSSDDSLENYPKEAAAVAREDSVEEPEKSKRSQSALQATYPKFPYFEDEDSGSREEFKPSPRFNLSIDSSQDGSYVSSYVAFGESQQGEISLPSTLKGLRIPSFHDFSAPSSPKEQVQVISQLRVNEKSLESKLSEALQALAKSEENLRIAQIHAKSLQVELEEVKNCKASREELTALRNRLEETDRERTDLQQLLDLKESELLTSRRDFRAMERQYQGFQQELARCSQEKLILELDNKTLREQKGILEDTVLSMKRTQTDHSLFTKEHRHRNRKSTSPNKHANVEISRSFLSPKALNTLHSPKPQVLKDLLVLLDLRDVDEILPCVERLRHRSRSVVHMEEFIGKLQGVILDCSPPEAFAESPSLNQMWKWVRRLVEEYMTIRKGPEVLQKLLGMLRLKTPADIPKTLETILTDYEQSAMTLSLLKAKLHIPLSSDHKRICEALDSRLLA